THFFIVRGDELWTSTGDFCLGGVTRGLIIEIARANGMTVRERNFSLHDVYNADEAFITGTFAGVTPVAQVDGRMITSSPGPAVKRLQTLYGHRVAEEARKGRVLSFS
ncbi:MAG: aminotransferase class IV, partial [Pseudomonadota bacterium]